jgi:DNA-binding NtrC family response regulator
MAPRPGPSPEHERPREGSDPPAQLVRLHRHSLTNVVVIGGTAERRVQVARAFHRESPLRGAEFVAVDGRTDDERLMSALFAWSADVRASEPNPLGAVEHGTLFIDHVERLSPETQRLLLGLAERILRGLSAAGDVPGPGRIVAGNPQPLATAVAGGRFSDALYDALDKVRVELEVPPGAEP